MTINTFSNQILQTMSSFKGTFWKSRMDGLIFSPCIKDALWYLENCLALMKLDDSSRKTSPRHFEEENPDVRQREKYMQVIQTRKILNKYEKYINQTWQK